MLLPIHRFVNIIINEYKYMNMNINLSRAKRRAPFQPSFRALTWRAWCLETKYFPLTPSVSRQRDEEGFQGLKRKALSCLDCCPFLPRKVVYRSLWLFRSSLLVVKGCVHVVLWLSKTGYWRPDSVVRHPALLSLTVHSALFPRRSTGSSTCRYIRPSWFQMH